MEYVNYVIVVLGRGSDGEERAGLIFYAADLSWRTPVAPNIKIGG
jgi:hypothetical protein